MTIADPVHGECYHSKMGARREARELYIECSGILDHFASSPKQPTYVLDVGLGLGYNATETIRAWLEAPEPGPLFLVSLEKFSDVIVTLLSPLAPWTLGWDEKITSCLLAVEQIKPGVWRGLISHSNRRDQIIWEIHNIDGSVDDLPHSSGASAWSWDYIWQDPFSPKINPTMWDSSWFQKLAPHVHTGSTLVTYSVARSVKDSLEAAGFQWRKIKPHSRNTQGPMKRHWLSATKKAALPSL
jgi:tRNA U34 5-methylaminomethyl-2-thiouridine-forming methyltransferase MnmC